MEEHFAEFIGRNVAPSDRPSPLQWNSSRLLRSPLREEHTIISLPFVAATTGNAAVRDTEVLREGDEVADAV